MNDPDGERTDPDWSLLPRDPTGFFGLGDGFDRRDLKRGYNRLLRRFKPEKHPEEFQRIRAAYEELERQLRYGQATAADLSGEAWGRSAPQEPAASRPAADGEAEPAETGTDPDALAARIEAGDERIEELYRRLKELPQKTPPDYYSLALFSDVVETGDRLWFLRWLLQGLQAWPGDPALGRLVHGFLSEQVPDAELPKVLVACSKAVSNDGFYALTEGAWDRLLRDRSFATFLDTLRKCEANLSGDGGDGSISGRVAFYVHALRFAMWRDPTDWKRDALDYVEEHFDQAPPHLEHDLDMLGVMREYLAVRDRFVASHEYCRRIDSVLESVFTGDPVAADRELVDCQLALLNDPEGVSRAFPPTDHEVHLTVYPLWSWVANDAAARLAEEPAGDVDYALWRGRVFGLLQQLNGRLGNSATGIVWHFSAWVYGLFKYGVLIVTVILAIAFPTSAVLTVDGRALNDETNTAVFVVAAIVVAAVILIGGFKWAFPLLDRHLWIPFSARMARRCYRKLWRADLMGFLERSVLDYFDFRALVAEQISDELETSAWISGFVQQDGAMAVYSLAQRFRV